MYQTDNKENTIYFIDDRNTASPKELAQYPWTEEDERRLDEITEDVWRTLGLPDEPPEMPEKSSDVAKYILEQQGCLTAWQLEKLCYYAQAWHYTWTGKRLIKENFCAWAKGPVCPELYRLHKGRMFIKVDDIPGDSSVLSADQKDSIDVMLEHYGRLSGEELVNLIHSEEPWIKARGNLPPDAHSNEIITLECMGEYYCKHLI